mgnify:CR=1 FL=1
MPKSHRISLSKNELKTIINALDKVKMDIVENDSKDLFELYHEMSDLSEKLSQIYWKDLADAITKITDKY